ncbi:sphingosine N-acyltransferase lag1 [Penicillium ochrochloron]
MAAPTYSQRPPANGGSARRRKTERVASTVTSTATAPTPLEPASNGHAQHESKAGRPRKKPRSLLRRLKRRAIKYTWSIPLLLLVAFASLYALDPTDSNIIHHFIFLSYRQDPTPGTPGPAQYGKGLWDIAFVSFYTIVLTFTREFIMQELLHPLARSAGIKSRAKQLRFMEQMYTAIYFGVSGPVGLYVMRRTPVWYFNTRGMYEMFPHRTHEAVFKFYYLFEAAYWAQQALVMVLGMEKPRKDYKELVAHHIVTLALIGDFFLAVSKSFHYIDSPLVIPFYALNVGTWIYLRHYLNLRILWSLLTEFRTVGPYELNWETQQYKCWISNIITFALLAMLQSLNLFWLYCLLRSAWKFISTGEKKDDRSEDESEGEGEGGLNGHVNGKVSGNGVAKGH